MAKRPTDRVPIPPLVRELAGDDPLDLVWRNEAGGLTYAVGDPIEYYLKWHPRPDEIDLEREAERMRWLGVRMPAPTVRTVGRRNGELYLCTEALPGRSAVDERWLADPASAVAAIGTGLRRLHDTVPVDGCPYAWRTDDRVADARRRLDDGLLDRAKPVGPEPIITAAEAVAHVERAVPDPDLVVCHGDACAPNTLLADDGSFLALVDLGALGVGDRWADLAVATWSTEWNYGPGWERPLLDAYGIEPDVDRMRYYRLLWDVGP
ncbi:MAG: aminoglycoside 3'-phosphotransferase [Actinomycetota bacterium]